MQTNFFSTSGGGKVIKNITVIGGGTMGAGIAQVNAQNGYKVMVVDNDEFAQKCMVQVAKSLDILAKEKFPHEVRSQRKWYDDIISNIKTTQSLPKGCEQADLLIESILEDKEKKVKKWNQLNKLVKDDCILAAHTSSFSIKEVTAGIEARHRVVGLHFFRPVWKMRLTEVIEIDATSKETMDTVIPYIHSIGKHPIRCKDTPGFIVNNLLYPYFMTALRFYEGGHASIEDIDRAMKLGAGLPHGPFEFMDVVGLDRVRHVCDNWHTKYPDDPKYFPSPTLDEKVAQHKLGMKTKQGFYTYKTSLY